MPKRNNVAFQEMHLLLVSEAWLYHPANKKKKQGILKKNLKALKTKPTHTIYH